MSFTAIPLPLTFTLSVVPGATAALVVAEAERVSGWPTARVLQVSLAFVLISLVGPATVQRATTLAVAFIEVMHVVDGIAIMWGVVRGARPLAYLDACDFDWPDWSVFVDRDEADAPRRG